MYVPDAFWPRYAARFSVACMLGTRSASCNPCFGSKSPLPDVSSSGHRLSRQAARHKVNNDDTRPSLPDLEKALIENNQRLKHIQFTLRTISFWLMLIFVVLIIEYGDDVRAAFKEWFSVIAMMLKG